MLRKTHRSRPSLLWRAAGVGLLLLLSPLSFAAAGQPIWLLTRAPDAQEHLLQVAQDGISLQQAVEQVRKRYQGQVIKATAADLQGRPVYRIRLVHEGRVREVLVDAQSGQILN
ncbi:MAG: PepSY domain-containing protein [Oceanospirillaceae bacterium]|nr:PepSY domain-containing protein [Oceanospirillaceae bacterium]